MMNIIRNYDTSVDVDEGIDEGDQGQNTQGAPTVAPNVQTAMNNGQQKGVNKRSHDAMIIPGHKVHSSRTESSSTAANVANLPALLSVVPTARIRKEIIQDVALPARQEGLSSIPVAQATTATAQAMVLLELRSCSFSPIACSAR